MSDQVISGNLSFMDASIEGVKIIDVKAYATIAATSWRRINALILLLVGLTVSSCRAPIVFNAWRAARVAFSDRAPAGEARACCFGQGL